VNLVLTLHRTGSARAETAVVTAESISLSRRMTVSQAAHVIIDSCIAHMLGNREGVMDGSDPESLHQMRVGLRRLRSALALFRDVVALPDGLCDELAWLGAHLGAARDWDVLAGSTLPAISKRVPADIGLAALLEAATGMANEKHALAAEVLSSDRFSALARELACWPRYVQPQAVDSLPLRHAADRLLVQCDKRLRRRGRKLATADADARHRMRVAAKKLRYASEFLASLYPARRKKRYMQALAPLQDALGTLNDRAVADNLLRELANARPGLASAAGYVRGFLTSSRQREERRLKKRWKRFTALKPFARPGQ
jgi:CHAD domain-containing protein